MYSNPPYFLLIAGLLIGMTSGFAFEATLKQGVQAWSKHRSTGTLATLQGSRLGFPFFGICIGICLFLASGLGIFAFPMWFAYGVAIPMTLFIGLLVWSQLGANLVLLERGGSKAMDLDLLE